MKPVMLSSLKSKRARCFVGMSLFEAMKLGRSKNAGSNIFTVGIFLFETSLCTPVVSAQLMASTVGMVVPQPVTWVQFQFRSSNFAGKFPRANQTVISSHLCLITGEYHQFGCLVSTTFSIDRCKVM